jgi:crotonobetainyl-CoA:carnitine CoA-transferase CaiB-like acyl-CoA transferase
VPGTVAAGFPVKFSDGEAGYATPAPWPGQDNGEIYGGLLGLSAGDQTALRRAGVI